MFVSLQYGRSVVYETFFKKNTIRLQDDLFGLFNTVVEDYFYERSTNDYFTSDDTDGPGQGIYFLQSFRIDKEYDVYDR